MQGNGEIENKLPLSLAREFESRAASAAEHFCEITGKKDVASVRLVFLKSYEEEAAKSLKMRSIFQDNPSFEFLCAKCDRDELLARLCLAVRPVITWADAVNHPREKFRSLVTGVKELAEAIDLWKGSRQMAEDIEFLLNPDGESLLQPEELADFAEIPERLKRFAGTLLKIHAKLDGHRTKGTGGLDVSGVRALAKYIHSQMDKRCWEEITDLLHPFTGDLTSDAIRHACEEIVDDI